MTVSGKPAFRGRLIQLMSSVGKSMSTLMALHPIHETPSIDLFASRINAKRQVYMSINPALQAHAINAFAHRWGPYVYIFPPFN